MINIILLFTVMMMWTYAIMGWFMDYVQFKKVLPLIILSVLITIGAKFLPEASSHLEAYEGKSAKAIIVIPEGFKVETFQVKSDSKWLWTENDGAIVYVVSKNGRI